MSGRKEIISTVWAGLLAVMVMGPLAPAEGKSVFTVACHAQSTIKAYLIEPNGVEYQGTFVDTLSFGAGATGLCVWPSLDRLFVTYEGSPAIAWMSTKRLTWDPSNQIEAPESNLAGVVADEGKGLLYVVARDTGRLYAFRFDVRTNELVLEYHDGRSYRDLEGLSGAYGIALDETTGRLYVANGSSTVRYYDTTTWALAGQVNMGRGAVGIDVDGDGHLYAGCFPATGGHTYLVRYAVEGDPNDAETRIEKDMGVAVTDIKIDRETGLLYATTRRYVNDRTGAVEVYDPTGWTAADPNNTLVLLDTENDADFSGPAGIAIGSEYKPSDRLVITKTDDVDEGTGCVGPGETITYTIRYYALEDANNVTITDTFDPGVDYPFFDWGTMTADPNYDPVARTYTWDVGFLPGWDPNVPGDPNEVITFTVRVNEFAEPGSVLFNDVAIESDTAYAEVRIETPVCCWGGDVIFVDPNAVPGGYGTSWPKAYTNLQDALARAGRGCGSTIWVKRGWYRPGYSYDDSFVIPDGVAVYGGFAGDEDPATFDLDDRDLVRNRTILSGLVGHGSLGQPIRAETVVTMGDNAILDGVTVEGAFRHGVVGDAVTFTVGHARIRDNGRRGIQCENGGNVTVQWTTIEDNGYEGIYHEGSGYTATVRNCVIRGNQRHGVRTNQSVLELTGSLIYANGVEGNYHGVSIGLPSAPGIIRNCTTVDQPHYGLDYTGSNPPDIRNCIFWNNNTEGDGESLRGYQRTYYSCVQDPNDPQGSSTPDAYGNITCDPVFAYDQPPYGFYHLDSDSPCRDMGDDTYVEYGEVDIDGDPRISGVHVDMGADEIACEDTSNVLDWTADGVINLEEFATISCAWLTHDPNDPVCDPNHPSYVRDPNAPGYIDPASFANWNSRCDFDADYDVDVDDLMVFVQNADWLWTACWRTEQVVLMQTMGLDGGELLLAADSALAVSAESVWVAEYSSLIEEMEKGAEIALFLERLWLNHPEVRAEIGEEKWREFVGEVYAWLYDLRDAYDLMWEK